MILWQELMRIWILIVCLIADLSTKSLLREPEWAWENSLTHNSLLTIIVLEMSSRVPLGIIMSGRDWEVSNLPVDLIPSSKMVLTQMTSDKERLETVTSSQQWLSWVANIQGTDLYSSAMRKNGSSVVPSASNSLIKAKRILLLLMMLSHLLEAN